MTVPTFQDIAQAARVLKIRRAVASARYAAGMPTAGPEMKQAVRDAYFAAYESAARRHGQLKQFTATSAAGAAVTAPGGAHAARLAAGEATGGRLSAVLTLLFYFSVMIALPVVIFCLVSDVTHWRVWFAGLIDQLPRPHPQADLGDIILEIIKATVILLFRILRFVFRLFCALFRPMTVYKTVENRVRSAAARAKIRIDQIALNLRYNSIVDITYLRYQQTVNWLNRNRWLIFFICWALWVCSVLIEKQEAQKYISWQEFQKHYDHPLPSVLLETRKEFGSNSHYQREEYEWFPAPAPGFEEGIGPEQDVIEESSIPLAPGDRSIRESLAGLRKGITVVEGGNVFCSQCRQWHCCELPY